MGKEERKETPPPLPSRYKVTRNSGALFTAWIIDERGVKYERRRAVINAGAELVRALLIARAASDARATPALSLSFARTRFGQMATAQMTPRVLRYIRYIPPSANRITLQRYFTRARPRFEILVVARVSLSLFAVIFERRSASICANCWIQRRIRIVNTTGILILSL